MCSNVKVPSVSFFLNILVYFNWKVLDVNIIFLLFLSVMKVIHFYFIFAVLQLKLILLKKWMTIALNKKYDPRDHIYIFLELPKLNYNVRIAPSYHTIFSPRLFFEKNPFINF